MDEGGIPISYQDEFSRWPVLYSIIDFFLPIKEIQINLLDFIKQTSRNLQPEFYSYDDKYFNDIDNEINEYKKPYMHILLCSFDNYEAFKDFYKLQFQKFIDMHTNNNDEWMIVYITPQNITSELEHVTII